VGTGGLRGLGVGLRGGLEPGLGGLGQAGVVEEGGEGALGEIVEQRNARGLLGGGPVEVGDEPGGREPAHRALGLRVELPEGVHLVPEELDPDGVIPGEGVDVHDPPPEGDLAGEAHELDRLEPLRDETSHEVLWREGVASGEGEGLGADGLGRGDPLGEGVHAGDDDPCEALLEPLEDVCAADEGVVLGDLVGVVGGVAGGGEEEDLEVLAEELLEVALEVGRAIVLGEDHQEEPSAGGVDLGDGEGGRRADSVFQADGAPGGEGAGPLAEGFGEGGLGEPGADAVDRHGRAGRRAGRRLSALRGKGWSPERRSARAGPRADPEVSRETAGPPAVGLRQEEGGLPPPPLRGTSP
jgi:hypothetical protein